MRKTVIAFLAGAAISGGASIAPQLLHADLAPVSVPGGVMQPGEAACLTAMVRARVDGYQASTAIQCEVQRLEAGDGWVCPVVSGLVKR